MHKEKPEYSALNLRVMDLELTSEISTFNGCTGTLHRKTTSVSPNRTYDAQINSAEQTKPLWSGEIRFEENLTTFELLIRSSIEPDSDLSWSGLPKVLSIFDGGYHALEKEEAERILTDLIDFHELVTCKVHFQKNGINHYFAVHFTEQENLKNLTEILVQIAEPNATQELDSIVTYVLELELFETTYFMVSTLEEREDDLLVFRLTSHIYRHSKREGRRIHVENLNISIPEGKVQEVSDFGIRIAFSTEIPKVGSRVSLTINGTEIAFRCIFSTSGTTGLKLNDHSPNARKLWQAFLLPFQYPDLVIRSEALHEENWNLFEESGYFKLPNGVGELVDKSKNLIFREWTRVDENGPDQGTTVLSKSGNKFVGTIGVTRINQEIWLSQALATSKDPKYLKHSRSLYAWRSRAIIQQQDGNWNLAFFSAKKAFLDRFFRKFLLLLLDDEAPYASWEEKNHYFMIPKATVPTPLGPGSKGMTKPSCKFLDEFMKSESSTIEFKQLGESIALISPPHLSLAQMATSLWANEINSDDLARFASLILESHHSFASVFVDKPADDVFRKNRNFEIVGGHPIVVWMCARPLFPKFLANSLRAFEIMHAKYGSQGVA